MKRERLVKTLQVRLTAKQLRHLETRARARGVSIGVIVREMVREHQGQGAIAVIPQMASAA